MCAQRISSSGLPTHRPESQTAFGTRATLLGFAPILTEVQLTAATMFERRHKCITIGIKMADPSILIPRPLFRGEQRESNRTRQQTAETCLIEQTWITRAV